jgi:hypothetical protein
MKCIRQSHVSWAINLNADYREDGQSSLQIHIRMEVVLVLLERVEAQRELFRVLRGKYLSWSALEKLLDLLNRAEFHLQELERIQTHNSNQE